MAALSAKKRRKQLEEKEGGGGQKGEVKKWSAVDVNMESGLHGGSTVSLRRPSFLCFRTTVPSFEWSSLETLLLGFWNVRWLCKHFGETAVKLKWSLVSRIRVWNVVVNWKYWLQTLNVYHFKMTTILVVLSGLCNLFVGRSYLTLLVKYLPVKRTR